MHPPGPGSGTPPARGGAAAILGGARRAGSAEGRRGAARAGAAGARRGILGAQKHHPSLGFCSKVPFRSLHTIQGQLSVASSTVSLKRTIRTVVFFFFNQSLCKHFVAHRRQSLTCLSLNSCQSAWKNAPRPDSTNCTRNTTELINTERQ